MYRRSNTFSYPEELPITSDDISRATKTDPELSKVYDFVANGWPNFVPDEQMKPYFRRRAELTIDKGCILWGIRVVIPVKYRDTLLNDLHNQHMGMCSMKSLAHSYLWWPGLDKDIETLVNACITCSPKCSSDHSTQNMGVAHPSLARGAY